MLIYYNNYKNKRKTLKYLQRIGYLSYVCIKQLPVGSSQFAVNN